MILSNGRNDRSCKIGDMERPESAARAVFGFCSFCRSLMKIERSVYLRFSAECLSL
jgi:hypothetical protein